MVRSRAARRRRRNSAGGNGAGMLGTVPRGDWLIPSGQLQTDGTYNSAAMWNSFQPIGPAAGTPYPTFGVVLVQIPTASPGPTPPNIGEIEVGGVQGEICISNPPSVGAVGQLVLNFGLYVSEYINSIGKWSLLDPSNGAETGRDEWLWLYTCVYNSLTGPTNALLDQTLHVSKSMRLRLGGGQSLVLACGYSNNTGTTGFLNITPNLRTLVRRAA